VSLADRDWLKGGIELDPGEQAIVAPRDAVLLGEALAARDKARGTNRNFDLLKGRLARRSKPPKGIVGYGP
jgi:hypothetical protein